MAQHLETSRLIARPITDGDVARMRILHSDARVMAALSPDGKTLKRAETVAMVGRLMVTSDDAGRGIWMFHTRTDGTFVGYCGARKYIQAGLNDTELLYAVPFTEWKNGYATEMAGAVIRHLFKSSGLSEMISLMPPANAASRRVMEKCGFAYEKDFRHAGQDHALYRLTRTKWAARGGQL
jgi:RimJ/RimL family protein N-acetyltransferase